jgi:hypothetical protein
MSVKKPTHELKFLNKVTNEKGKLGVGWENENGSISISLNPMVVLTQSNDLVLTLFRHDPNFFKSQVPVAQVVETEFDRF